MAERRGKHADSPRRAIGQPDGPKRVAPTRPSTKKPLEKDASPSAAKSTPVKPKKERNKATKSLGKDRKKSSGKDPKKWGIGRIVKSILKWAAIVILLFALVGTIAVAVFYNRVKLPAPNQEFTTATTFLYYRDGTTKLGELSVQNRQPIDYATMPQNVKDAVVAAEDRTFWTNRGVSLRGLVRSAWNIAWGGELASGSTITQQYIKVLYLNSERSMSRKFRELALAAKMSNAESKEEILAGYLNTIYFGRGAYGIQAAARTYFDVEAKDLTAPQSAALAAILNSPAYLDPADGDNVQRFTERYNYVIDGMRLMGAITQQQYDEYNNSPPAFPKVSVSQRYAGSKGFLIKMVEDELRAKGLSQAQINGGGLKVTTTFDATMQDAMIATAQSVVKRANDNARRQVNPNDLKLGMASVSVGTGEVLAIYGGPDYIANSRNWATTARPAASSFKPYALVAGLRDGFSLKSYMRGDTWTPPGDQKVVKNAGHAQYGPITLLRATELSSNTAYVDLASRMPAGPEAIIKAATDTGLKPGAGWDANARLPLGVAEVTPIDQANAYATFANSGRRAEAHVVKEVKDIKGHAIYSEPTNTTPTIEPDIVRDVNFALQSVVQRGTGTGIQGLGRDVAAKTGTNEVGNAVTSSWLIGYTRQISTSVMMVAGEGGTGDLLQWSTNTGYYPGVAWLEYMRIATQGQPKLSFDPPVYVNGAGREVNRLPNSLSPQPSPTPTPTPETPSPSSSSATPTETLKPSKTPTKSSSTPKKSESTPTRLPT